VTITASYAPYSYTVTFDIGDGTRTGGGALSQTLQYGGSATAPSVSPPTGYDFDGWSGSYTSVTSSRTITAQYTLKSYTVSFNTSGGSSVSSQSVTHGSTVVPPAAPTKTGYTFTGWYPSLDTIVTSSGTFHAQWSAHSYTVFFNSNGGSYVPTQAVHHDQYADTPTSPTRAGYSFIGWTPSIATTKITSTTTFSAQWQQILYEVTFDSNGGTAVAGQTIGAGGYAQTPTSPTRSGYEFDGWSPSISATQINSNTVFEAQWTAITLTHITVANPPTKTKYFEGENFSSGGMALFAHYSNGDIRYIPGFNYSPMTPLDLRQTQVTAERTEGGVTRYVSYPIQVVQKLESISVSYSGATTFTEGDSIDASDITVTAHYENGTSTPVSGFTYSPDGELETSDEAVNISYTENGITKNASFDITVNQFVPMLSSIDIITEPTKLSYYTGDQFDPTGMVVRATYTDGDTETISRSINGSAGYTIPTGILKLTNTSVTIRYTEGTIEVTTTCPITVLQAQLTLVTGGKTSYIEGESFDPTGMQLTAIFNNGTTMTITGDDCDVYPQRPLTLSDESVSLRYGGGLLSVDITVSAASDPDPDPENPDDPGGEGSGGGTGGSGGSGGDDNPPATYTNEETSVQNAGYVSEMPIVIISGYNLTSHSDSLDVAKVCDDLSIEKADLVECRLIYTLSNIVSTPSLSTSYGNSSIEIDSGKLILTFEPVQYLSMPDDISFTVSSQDTFTGVLENINVVYRSLVESEPEPDEPNDPDNPNPNEPENPVNPNPGDDETGDEDGTAATLNSIAITTPPNKTVYLAGETFSSAGMVVTATLSDNSEIDVTDVVTFSDDALILSDDEVVITYVRNGIEKTATVDIVVKIRPSRRTHKELPFECSSGVGSVNTYSGKFCFNHKDVTVGAGSFVLGVAHNYNSHWLSNSRIRADLRNTYMGRNWKLDIQQYVFADDDNLIYIDAAGNCNDFMLVGDNVYLDTLGSGSKIVRDTTSVEEYYVLSDAAGNSLTFNEDGLLVDIISGINEDIRKHIVYDADRKPLQLYDIRKQSRKIEFAYDNDGLLDTIITKENGTEKHRITCTYNAGKLEQLSERLQNVTGSVSQVSRMLTNFVYDSSNNLSVVYNAQDKTGLRLVTENDTLRIDSVEIGAVVEANGTFVFDNTVKAKADFTYWQYLTSVTSKQGVVMCYELNNDGDCVSIYERYNNTMMSSVMPSPEGKRLFALADSEDDVIVANGTKSYSTAQGSLHPTAGYYEVNFGENDLTADEITSIISTNAGKYVMLSAWVYGFVGELEPSDLPQLTLKFTKTNDSVQYDIPINKHKHGQWQYVSKVVKADAVDDSYTCKLGVTKDNDTNLFAFYISDFRITPLLGGSKLSNENSILGLTAVTVTSGIDDTIMTHSLYQLRQVDNGNFVTESDIEHTLRDKFLKSDQPNKRFTFYYNNLTKAIADVSSVTFRNGNESENVTISISSLGASELNKIVYSETTIGETVVQKHRIYFIEGGKKVYTDFTKYNSITDSKTYFMDGRLKETKDEYNVKTTYIYDGNGNLTQKKIWYSPTAAGMQQSFVYDENSDELLSFTDGFGITHSVSPKSESQPFSLTSATTNNATDVATTYGYDSWLRNTSITDNNGTELLTTDDVANTFTYNDANRLHTVSDGADTYTVGYDQFGNVNSMLLNGDALFSRTYNYSSSGNSIFTSYANEGAIQYKNLSDKYGRLSSVKHGNNVLASWIYKDINSTDTTTVNTSGARLVEIDDNLCDKDTTFTYDANGNITSVNNVINGQEYTLEASNSSEASGKYGGTRLRYKLTATQGLNHWEYIDYDENKLLNPRITSINYTGNEFDINYEYDNLGRIKYVTKYRPISGGTPYIRKDEYIYRDYDFDDETYTSSVVSTVKHYHVINDDILDSIDVVNYDDFGNITGISNSDTFTYNTRGQLLTEKVTIDDVVHEYKYEYDIRGNVLFKKEKTGINTYTTVIDYGYDNNQLSSITVDGDPLYITYDALGNPLKYKVEDDENSPQNMWWTRGSLLDQYSDGTYNYKYLYDINGVRVGKKKYSGTTLLSTVTYMTDGAKILGEIDSEPNTTPTFYKYDLSGICFIDTHTARYYISKDPFGNVTEVFRDNAGVKMPVASYTYDAFGKCNEQLYEYTLQDDTLIETISPLHYGKLNPFRWKGYYWDSESGLYHIYLAGCGTRYYDPETGRFVDALFPEMLDPVEIGGINPYSLGVHNPLLFPVNNHSLFPSISLVPNVDSDGDVNAVSWWSWAIAALQIVVGVGLCFVAGGQILGAGLIVSGSSMMLSNVLVSSGVNSQLASMVISGLDIIAGTVMLFTPLASLGASMIGSGLLSVAGGYISLSAGADYNLGAYIGGLVGGVAGGYVYQGVQYARAYHFLSVNGSANPKQDLNAFDGIPRITKLKSDTAVYRAWGNESGKLGHWVSPVNYGATARSMLSLPPANSAANVYSTSISGGTKVLSGIAAPLFGQSGGGIQWWVALLS
jgi:RHS repeat-associated protein/uncharacterized repeat protein (TIGR02543 family)